MSRPKQIEIKGARVHNLKNIDVTIPHNEFVVITGQGQGTTQVIIHGSLILQKVSSQASSEFFIKD